MYAKVLFVLVLAGWNSSAMAEPIVVIDSELLSRPAVVVSPIDSTIAVVYQEIAFNFGVKMRLWATRSSDGGNAWTTPQLVPMGVNEPPTTSFSFQESASLLHAPQSDFVLFHHYRIDTPSNIWRSTSAEGSIFASPSLVDLGWPPVGDAQPGSGYPSAIVDGAASMAMLYQRFVGDGSDSPGLYLARSADLGASWSSQRTLVSADIQLGSRTSLAYLTNSSQYAAAYVSNPSAGEQRVLVKITGDAADWSGTPVLDVGGENASPFLIQMPDGALVLFYSRNFSPQSDLFMRRSEDGIQWASEVRLTETPELRDLDPFAVVDSLPGIVDLYWVRDSTNGPQARIVHMKVATDTIFASGFGG